MNEETIEAKRLTKPLLKAIEAALSAALAGEFEGGDFDGLDRDHFERALEWIEGELERRAYAKRRIEL
jgi:hypothetical protein